MSGRHLQRGAFWEMHDLLLTHQDALRPEDLVGYAEQLGLDVDRFSDDLREHAGAAKIAEDVDSADLSGVSGTPTFPSSTAAATTAPTTSPPSPPPCERAGAPASLATR